MALALRSVSERFVSLKSQEGISCFNISVPGFRHDALKRYALVRHFQSKSHNVSQPNNVCTTGEDIRPSEPGGLAPKRVSSGKRAERLKTGLTIMSLLSSSLYSGVLSIYGFRCRLFAGTVTDTTSTFLTDFQRLQMWWKLSPKVFNHKHQKSTYSETCRKWITLTAILRLHKTTDIERMDLMDMEEKN